MKNKNAVLWSAILLTGVNLYSQVLGFAYRVWLARVIGAEAIGLYQLVMPLYSIIMSLCVSGLTVAVSRLTASYSALGREKAIRQAVRTARIGYAVLVVSVSAVVAPLSDGISVWFLGDARTRLGVLLLLPCVLLTGWENIHKNYFYGRKNVIPPAIAEILEQTSRAVAILGLLMYFKPVFEESQVGIIVLGMIVSEVLSAGLLTLFYRRDRRNRVIGGEPENEILPRILRIAAPVAAANVLSNIIGSLNSIIIPGRLIVSGMPANEALSAYGVAFGMTMPLLGLPLAFTVSIGLVMLPRLAESAALGDIHAARRHVRSALTVSLSAIGVCASVLIPFGVSICRALFKNENAGQFMTPLVVATIFVCLEQVMGAMLNGLGRQQRTAVNLITAGIVQLVVTYWAVGMPELGLKGFVLAYILGNALGTGLCFFDLARLLYGKKEKFLCE